MAKNTPAPVETDSEPEIGKGHATPSRKEREAARRRPLVGGSKAEQRQRLQTERERQRVGMANGEEKFLPARDKGPQKRFVRDYIDARFSVGEFLIPIMLVFVVITFTGLTDIATIGQVVLLVFFAVAIVDALIAGHMITRKLQAKYGDRTERVRWYAAMRAFQFRMLRMPKPQVKRGAFPEV